MPSPWRSRHSCAWKEASSGGQSIKEVKVHYIADLRDI
ncbi:BgTH12-04658 [Blumeria graminis f. sp. triticale]|uniref:BgTH12-04658 n=1 Tax=Blumeria graminis f. sp. triticale TaxID=1689686 RepID=A0A9W4DBX0_BLUGR|nr:BgTH12-04658 [Blumeria graminis f. sp. triticale]